MTRLKHGFFCTFVHSEAGGKATAVGIWGSKCIFSEGPPNVTQLAVHFHLQTTRKGQAEAVLLLQLPGDEPLEIPVDLNVGEHTATNVSFNFGPVLITEPGLAVATLRIPDEAFEAAVDLEFEFGGPRSGT